MNVFELRWHGLLEEEVPLGIELYLALGTDFRERLRAGNPRKASKARERRKRKGVMRSQQPGQTLTPERPIR